MCHTGSVNALLTDSAFLFSGSADTTVRVWEKTNMACLQVFSGHTGGVLGLALASKLPLLFSAGVDGAVNVWDTSSLTFTRERRLLRTLRAHSGPVFQVTEAGNFMVSGGQDGNIFVWQYMDGLPRIRPFCKVDVGTGAIMGLKVVQSRFLVATGEDMFVRMWDLEPLFQVLGRTPTSETTSESLDLALPLASPPSLSLAAGTIFRRGWPPLL